MSNRFDGDRDGWRRDGRGRGRAAALAGLLALGIAGCGSDQPGSADPGEAAGPTAAEPAAAGQAPPADAAPRVVYSPSEANDPPWLAARVREQRERWSGIGTFHDFRLVNRLAESGITFRHTATQDSGKRWIPVHYDHGNGVSVADVDGDGHLDLYFPTQVGNNQLWRNRGDGTFEDVTWESLGGGLFDRISVAASFADTDNDGDADLYVTTVRGPNVFYENDGEGRFEDATASSGLGHEGHSGASVFFDYNRDGLLDVFLLNVGRYTTDQTSEDGKNRVGLKDAFSGHLKPDRAERHLLFENRGDNRFEDVTEAVGLVDETWSGAALPVDFDADGWIDLYLVNMQGLDEYYENDGGKRFVRRSREVFPRSSWGAMGGQSFDYDNDGDMDLYLVDMHSDMGLDHGNSSDFSYADEQTKFPFPWPPDFLLDDGNGIPGNSFFRNDGGGVFVEVSDEIGAENYWPWGLSAGDLNADGYEDVFIASSMNYPWRYAANAIKLNVGGERFLDAESMLGVEPRERRTGPWFELDCGGEDEYHGDCPKGHRGKVSVHAALGSRSSVLFDLDEDGDLDVVTNDFHSEPLVLVSDLSEKKQVARLQVELVGTRSNRDGLGATVSVTAGDARYTRFHDGQSGYLSQSRMPLYFGLGDAEQVDEVRVRWPSGAEQTVAGPIPLDETLRIREEP